MYSHDPLHMFSQRVTVFEATFAPYATHCVKSFVLGDKRGMRAPNTGDDTVIAPLRTVTIPLDDVTDESNRLVSLTVYVPEGNEDGTSHTNVPGRAGVDTDAVAVTIRLTVDTRSMRRLPPELAG